MSTSYTQIIEQRSDVGFDDFVWRCARAFGYYVVDREESLDAPIRLKVTPDLRYEQAIVIAQTELARVIAMVPSDVKAAREERYEADRAWYEAENEKKRVLAARYDRLIDAVTAWTPPTPDHEDLKKFMLQQLTSSKSWDCTPYTPTKPSDYEEYHKELVEMAKEDVERAQRRLKDHVEAVDKHNAWVQALVDSVGMPPQGVKP